MTEVSAGEQKCRGRCGLFENEEHVRLMQLKANSLKGALRIEGFFCVTYFTVYKRREAAYSSHKVVKSNSACLKDTCA